MSLIKSISGIRGTIGGLPGNNLTPLDIVKFTSAFAEFISQEKWGKTIVVGRDARLSGQMVAGIVNSTLISKGFNVVDLGLSTTPSVELAVSEMKAAGGIIITASHNPKQWNALKLLNNDGEFLDEIQAGKVLDLAEKADFKYAEVTQLGAIQHQHGGYIDRHIERILEMPLVDVEAIKKKQFRIAVDAVNSTGGIAVPKLLKALGVSEVIEINCEPSGHFAHNPEPLPENLSELSQTVKSHKADLGISVDPDVDRLALVCENGEMFGEEYTLVAVAQYVLQHTPGNTVSNLSSTRALRDITEKVGMSYSAAAVGEVNVVKQMKATNAIIGGEGNGGVIYPEVHYGRDALVGIALFLSHLAKIGKKASTYRSTLPHYVISKNKISIDDNFAPDLILEKIQAKYKRNPINTIDGVKIEFDDEWVHLRKSNTEPIIRIYAESKSATLADNLAERIMKDIGELLKSNGK
ncbi:MAG: phosphoglucosamine mutase [Bacteroidia bacterium]|nr:phosphoglucosamine mutase [Bacteroidia bacterium]MCO5253957.1 phosphoglucosamine mutase [Bacteroidota bacterium]MCZ2130626.1 phosphoglucosamine mutase [Bacteroidia bacterium]